MLRITMEIVPHGDEIYAKKLADMIIVNDGTQSVDIGNYDIVIRNHTNVKTYQFEIKNYSRKEGFLDLISLALNKGKDHVK